MHLTRHHTHTHTQAVEQAVATAAIAAVTAAGGCSIAAIRPRKLAPTATHFEQPGTGPTNTQT